MKFEEASCELDVVCVADFKLKNGKRFSWKRTWQRYVNLLLRDIIEQVTFVSKEGNQEIHTE